MLTYQAARTFPWALRVPVPLSSVQASWEVILSGPPFSKVTAALSFIPDLGPLQQRPLAPSGGRLWALGVLMLLPATWGHRKFGACLRTICRHSSHCHFCSRSFHLGISSYIPQNLLCFCETPHSRGRCRAPSQIQALCASSITILSSTLPRPFNLVTGRSLALTHQIFS